ncbi:MAG: glutathione S-transferase [Pikeienuella sp.]
MDRTYSSWSLRGWLLFEAFGLPIQTIHTHWPSPEFDVLLKQLAPVRTVPALKSDGALLWDSLAIAETLAERHPDISFWPMETAARGAARSITCEMHSGFSALRQHCPMNLGRQYANFEPSPDVLADVARAEELWSWARSFGGDGPFLFGDYSIADVFYTPLASRIDTYGLSVSNTSEKYIEALHQVPAFRRWRAMAKASWRANPKYEFELSDRDGWPGEVPLPAKAIENATAVNSLCPYSGKPIRGDSLAEISGVVIGYCNQFCRDKTVADAAAWPKTIEVLNQHRAG